MTRQKEYQGIIVPLVTPLTENYQLDAQGVENIFSHMYSNDVLPFILGTTGESSSISLPVKQAYVREAVRNKKPGTKLYAGISSNCVEESVDFAKFCFDSGVDAVAATLPSYYALTEGQMRTYFLTLAEQIKAPVIIYNIPGTTHMSIPLSLIDELSHNEYIVGTKDSERSEERLNESLRLWSGRSDFSHFLGWAAKSAHALIHGSDGLIPSTGNLHPGLYTDMAAAVNVGDHEKAYYYQYLSDELGKIYQGIGTLGESLWALKVLMHQYGLCQSVAMPPLTSLSGDVQEKLLNSLSDFFKKENIQLNVSSNV